MNKKTEELKIMIEQSDFVEFGNFGDGVSDEWISKAEQHLGYPLPKQYKWWLKNFGGGEIEGEEIYSIYEVDFENVSGGDIVNMAGVNIRNGILPEGKIAVSEPIGTGEIYYFDLTSKEDKVYMLNSLTADVEEYAEDFLDFLVRRIRYHS